MSFVFRCLLTFDILFPDKYRRLIALRPLKNDAGTSFSKLLAKLSHPKSVFLLKTLLLRSDRALFDILHQVRDRRSYKKKENQTVEYFRSLSRFKPKNLLVDLE